MAKYFRKEAQKQMRNILMDLVLFSDFLSFFLFGVLCCYFCCWKYSTFDTFEHILRAILSVCVCVRKIEQNVWLINGFWYFRLSLLHFASEASCLTFGTTNISPFYSVFVLICIQKQYFALFYKGNEGERCHSTRNTFA